MKNTLQIFVYFNSRLYMRGNIKSSKVDVSTMLFQFTPLHERQRCFHRIYLSAFQYFNSRLYMRGNQHDRRKLYSFNDFNSRLYMRGNGSGNNSLISIEIFQFTPLHERQRLSQNCNGGQIKFQFTPLHERQHNWLKMHHKPMNFNSRLYMRGNKCAC